MSNEFTIEDKIALTEAYRAYEMLSRDEQEKIPQDFVNKMLYGADLSLVKPFKTVKEMDEYDFSKKGLYLMMYMSTFE